MAACVKKANTEKEYAMPNYRMFTLTRPVEGREDDYNHWYQKVHLPEVMTMPGMKAAQRFKIERVIAGESSFPYAAIYEIETDDIDGTLAGINEALVSGRLTMTDAVDGTQSFGIICEEFGEKVTAK